MEDGDRFVRMAKERGIEIDRERQRLERRVEAMEILERALATERQKARERLSALDHETQRLSWGHLIKKALPYASPETEAMARIAAKCAEQLSELLTRAVSWMLHPPPFATSPAPSHDPAPRPSMAPRMDWNFEPERRRR
jgi:hypothetical protein